MGGRRCCCQGCEVFTDDFNRTASTDLGGGWVEDSGDWEIVSCPHTPAHGSNELQSTDDGLIYTTTRITKTKTQRRYLLLKILNTQEGKSYRLAICVDGGGDYMYLEFACAASNIANITLNTNTGGVDSGTPIDEETGSWNAGDDYTLFACCSEEGVYGGCLEQSWVVWDCEACDGDRAGIANESGTTVEFDNFGFYLHALDNLPNVDTLCPDCPCECDGHCIPKTLTLTLESSCNHRDGLTCTLNIDETNEPYFEWIGECDWPTICDDPESGLTTRVYFRLHCLSNSPSTGTKWALCTAAFQSSASTTDWGTVDPTSTCAPAYSDPGEYSTSYTCDPLEIIWRTATASCSGGPTCLERFVVTE